LRIAKLDAQGCSRESLCLIYSFLDNRHQKVKIDGPFSTDKRLSLAGPQISAVGPLFFNNIYSDLSSTDSPPQQLQVYLTALRTRTVQEEGDQVATCKHAFDAFSLSLGYSKQQDNVQGQPIREHRYTQSTQQGV